MGKNEKEHRKRVKARNERIKQEQRKMDKIYKAKFDKLLQERMSELTGQTININKENINEG